MYIYYASELLENYPKKISWVLEKITTEKLQ